MKTTLKKLISLLAAAAIMMSLVLLVSCGASDPYADYSKAYEKTASVGSLDVDLKFDLKQGSDKMSSGGNMKMNSKNDVYYEMEVNGTKITQYVTGGEIHTIIDGQEMAASTKDKDKGVEKADPNGEGVNDKTNSIFNTEKFMEEFSGMIEAGKIKELGVLDPIPSRYVKTIEESESGDDTVYTITFPDEFLNSMLKTMINEQNSDKSPITFDELKDFKCTVKENKDGYVYEIKYSGYTNFTVKGEYMTSGSEETFKLNIDLKMTINNPGTAVEVVIPE